MNPKEMTQYISMRWEQGTADMASVMAPTGIG
jgi:hypothetical protein